MKTSKLKKQKESNKWLSRKFLLSILFFVIATGMVFLDKIDGLTYLTTLAANFGLYSIGNGLDSKDAQAN